MKKQILTSLLMVAGAFGLSAQTYSVNLSVNMTGQTIDPNGVHIAGSFQSEIGASDDWVPGETAMVDEGNNSGVYIRTNLQLPNGVYEYKYINGNDWPMSENVPSESQVGGANSNRFFVVDGADVIIPPVYFGGNAANDGIVELDMVRFTVDMSLQTVDPSGVFCAGDWQGFDFLLQNPVWSPTASKLHDVNTEDNMSLYTGIFYLTPGATGSLQYKFLNGASYETINGACTTSNNRTLTLAGNTTTAKFCYASCDENCVELATYNLTLNVDMRFNCGFDVNSSDSVDVAGTFNGFSGGPAYLLSDDNNDGIYSITIPGVTAGTVEYKARIIRNANFGSGWEPGENNSIVLTGDSIAPARCFGFPSGACGVVPAPSTVTFTVDMTDETPAANIFLIGSFTNPQWQGGPIEMLSVGLGIYSVTVADICPGKLNFKFVNGPVSVTANEESFPDANDRQCVEPSGVGGWNRVYIRPSANPSTVGYKFNTCQEIVGIESVVSPIAAMFPNPADLSTLIQFSSENASYTVTVIDVLGKRVDFVNNVKGSYIIQRGNLNSGVYFVQVTDVKGNTATQKLIFR